MSEKTPDAESTGDWSDRLVFDPAETEVTLANRAAVSRADVETLVDEHVVEVETERRDGEEVVTSLELDVVHLGLLGTELDTVERRLGDRFSRRRWRPEVRLRL